MAMAVHKEVLEYRLKLLKQNPQENEKLIKKLEARLRKCQ